MVKWEYFMMTMKGSAHDEDSADEIKAFFNNLGAKGWELVSMTPAKPGHEAFCAFKRPVEDEEDLEHRVIELEKSDEYNDEILRRSRG